MHAVDEDYVSVPEAASLLAVAPSTVRRWIRQGDVPAYRVGRRRVALRRSDLTALITPIRSHAEQVEALSDIEELKRRKLTPEEVQRGLEALERAQRHAKEIMARRGGEPLRPTLEIIHEMREERLRELG